MTSASVFCRLPAIVPICMLAGRALASPQAPVSPWPKYPPNSNVVAGEHATVVAGEQNLASNSCSAVVAGAGNQAVGEGSFIGAGGGNHAVGISSVVPGGEFNVAAGAASFAAGQQAQAWHDGTFVWSDGPSMFPFCSTAANQFLVRAAGGVGINTNVTNGRALVVAGDAEVLGGLRVQALEVQTLAARDPQVVNYQALTGYVGAALASLPAGLSPAAVAALVSTGATARAQLADSATRLVQPDLMAWIAVTNGAGALYTLTNTLAGVPPGPDRLQTFDGLYSGGEPTNTNFSTTWGWTGQKVRVASQSRLRDPVLNSSSNGACLCNSLAAWIMTPLLETGVQTISFEAAIRNTLPGWTAGFCVQLSTNDGASWQTVQSYSLTGMTVLTPTLTVSIPVPARVRLQRTSVDPGDIGNNTGIVLDNIRVTSMPVYAARASTLARTEDLAEFVAGAMATGTAAYATVASGLAGPQAAAWDAAASWGNHAEAGYLTSECDPCFESWYRNDFTYSVWMAESDPAFREWCMAGNATALRMAYDWIWTRGLNADAWDAASGWGNHAEAGYLTSECDPRFESWYQNDFTYSVWRAESDPAFREWCMAGNATALRMAYDWIWTRGLNADAWDAASGWGNHAEAGYLKRADMAVAGVLTNHQETAVLFSTNVMIAGSLTVSNGLVVTGPVSGITAAQVGAVAPTDARYLSSLTNAAAFATAEQGQAAVAALPRSGGAMSGSLDLAGNRIQNVSGISGVATIYGQPYIDFTLGFVGIPGPYGLYVAGPVQTHEIKAAPDGNPFLTVNATAVHLASEVVAVGKDLQVARSLSVGHEACAQGADSVAQGAHATAAHDNTFVWSDGQPIGSTTGRSFTVHATNGIYLLGGPTYVAAPNISNPASAMNFGAFTNLLGKYALTPDLQRVTEAGARTDRIIEFGFASGGDQEGVNVGYLRQHMNYDMPRWWSAWLDGHSWLDAQTSQPEEADTLAAVCERGSETPRVITTGGLYTEKDGFVYARGNGWIATEAGGIIAMQGDILCPQGNVDALGLTSGDALFVDDLHPTVRGSGAAINPMGCAMGVNVQVTAGYAFAMGANTRADHSGTFIWSDGHAGDARTTAPNQFVVDAQNGTHLRGGAFVTPLGDLPMGQFTQGTQP